MPSDNTKRESYSCSLISQGNAKFYSLTMPSEVLAETCFVSTRDADPHDGFQRILDKNRAQEIADYITRGGRMLKYDDGAMWLQKGSPWAQRMDDPSDEMIRRIVLTVAIEFLD